MQNWNDFMYPFIWIQGSLMSVISLRSEKIKKQERRKRVSYRRPALAQKPKSKCHNCGFILRGPVLENVGGDEGCVAADRLPCAHINVRHFSLLERSGAEGKTICLSFPGTCSAGLPGPQRQSTCRYEWVVATWETTLPQGLSDSWEAQGAYIDLQVLKVRKTVLKNLERTVSNITI